MKAAVVSDGSLVIEDRPTPQIGGNQILVDVVAAGINRADLLQVRGLHPAPPGWPADVPGLEFSGVVSETGPAAHTFNQGDRVFGIAEVDVVIDLVGGGYLELDVAVCNPYGRIVIVGLLADATAPGYGRGAAKQVGDHRHRTQKPAGLRKAIATALFGRSVVPLFERKLIGPSSIASFPSKTSFRDTRHWNRTTPSAK
jgi:NADPH:quinone reductase-like Zn-dependent oxidoreductase